jgi:hypothetical protein
MVSAVDTPRFLAMIRIGLIEYGGHTLLDLGAGRGGAGSSHAVHHEFCVGDGRTLGLPRPTIALTVQRKTAAMRDPVRILIAPGQERHFCDVREESGLPLRPDISRHRSEPPLRAKCRHGHKSASRPSFHGRDARCLPLHGMVVERRCLSGPM